MSLLMTIINYILLKTRFLFLRIPLCIFEVLNRHLACGILVFDWYFIRKIFIQILYGSVEFQT